MLAVALMTAARLPDEIGWALSMCAVSKEPTSRASSSSRSPRSSRRAASATSMRRNGVRCLMRVFPRPAARPCSDVGQGTSEREMVECLELRGRQSEHFMQGVVEVAADAGAAKSFGFGLQVERVPQKPGLPV